MEGPETVWAIKLVPGIIGINWYHVNIINGKHSMLQLSVERFAHNYSKLKINQGLVKVGWICVYFSSTLLKNQIIFVPI